jgi:hypothetical protein
MKRGLLGSLVGLLAGTLLGGLLAYVVFYLPEDSQPPSGWTSYPTIADVSKGSTVLSQHVYHYGRYCLFQGLLLGGGFGAVVGAVLGGVSAIVVALRAGGR